MQEGLTLFDLSSKIKSAVENAFPLTVWVVAEVSEMSINRNGHCYLELIEKDKNGNQTIAKARATIWANIFRMLKPYFETTTGHEFSSGLKILLKVSVEFHELYGLSLNVKDIDPAYTIGDIEKRKQEIIKRLINEGVLEMNQELNFPAVPQKIAIISSETAAGYGDFINQLEQNPNSYKFYHKLFPAIMQGENTETSIIAALDKIYSYESFFDVVVIIRGGGSKSDLNSFDSYWLAYHITQFPLPIISGIGHERDDTIVDLVSHTRCKTPTAVAELLITKLSVFDSQLDEFKSSFIDVTEEILNQKQSELKYLTAQFSPAVINALAQKRNFLEKAIAKTQFVSATYMDSKKHRLNNYISELHFSTKSYTNYGRHKLQICSNSIDSSLKLYFDKFKYFLEIYETRNNNLDPKEILKRGYSITLKNGKPVKSAMQIENGDIIESILFDGKIKSRITQS